MNISSGSYNLIDENGINKSIFNVIRSGVDYYTYSPTQGIKELREEISRFLKNTENMVASCDDMIITTGSQQSLNIVADSLLKSGDTVLIEQPTYYGAIELFKSRNINVVGVQIDENGIDLKDLKSKIVEYKPKLIYVVPTFNNPTGYAWGSENRKKFLSIINEYNVLVIEDNPYSLINFTDEKYDTLYKMNEGKNIIYLGTFSKIIAPSINTGYIISKSCIDKFTQMKKSSDLCTSAFLQYIILDYLQKNDIQKIAKVKNEIYKKKMLSSIEKLKQQFGDEIEFISNIKGGLFYMVKFKNGVDENVFQSGNEFYLSGEHSNITRVNICS